jgi:hypothetical protein
LSTRYFPHDALSFGRPGRSAVSEHAFLAAMLAVVGLEVAWVGYMAYRVHRTSERLEGLSAAVYLEVRKVLGQSR